MPATVVARGADAGFTAGPSMFSVTSGGSAPLLANTTGTGNAATVQVQNPAGDASSLVAITTAGHPGGS